MAANTSLLDTLSSALPSEHAFNIYHVHTPPAACQPIFSAPPDATPALTTCKSHFLAIGLPPGKQVKDECLVLALEVYIYATDDLINIFVSKADSTGFLKHLNLPSSSGSLARQVSTAFLSYLVRCQDGSKRIVVSLFARSQNQYLFPGSIENADKHVLDDRQLIRWWCKALDPVLREYQSEQEGGNVRSGSTLVTTASAYVTVPGCDKHETRTFFPPSAKSDPPERPRWNAGHPLYHLARDPTNPPRCLVPRFPDDPKARFLDTLDEEISDLEDGDGQWRSVRSLEQFWELMSYRQECSAGRLVGFLWIVITSDHSQQSPDIPVRSEPHRKPNTVNGDLDLPTPAQSQSLSMPVPGLESESCNESQSDPIEPPASPPPSSPVLPPISPADPSRNGIYDEKLSSLLEMSSSVAQPVSTSAIPTPVPLPSPSQTPPSSASLLLDASQYHILITRLLELDFAGSTIAAKSTSDWISFAKSLAKVPYWEAAVRGTKLPHASASVLGTDTPSQPKILDTGLVRKRKQEADKVPQPELEIAAKPQINVLSAGLVRKKTKRTS